MQSSMNEFHERMKKPGGVYGFCYTDVKIKFARPVIFRSMYYRVDLDHLNEGTKSIKFLSDGEIVREFNIDLVSLRDERSLNRER
jgi:hypothetical protein